MMDPFFPMTFSTREPLGSLALVVISFDLKLSGKIQLPMFLIPSKADVSRYSRGHMAFSSPHSLAFSTRRESNRKLFSL